MIPFGLPRGLFWDIPPMRKLDARKHEEFIICRVVELGRLEDWRAIQRYYGEERMRRAVTSARELSPQAIGLCCAAFNLNKEDFRCCTSRPFPQSPWIS